MKVCFAEIRKRDGSVINVNMGCKQAKACETNHEMNFRDPNPWQQQCQFSNKKFGSNSVCRQCCYVDNCFNAYGLEARGGTILWDQFDRALWETMMQNNPILG